MRLLLLLSLTVVLMVLQQRHHRLSTLRDYLTVVVAPIQYTVNLPFRFAAWLDGTLTSRRQLIAENTYLQAKQLLLKAQLQKFSALEQENAQLRALLQSAAKVSDTVLVAQLLAVDTHPFTQQIVLDKGKQHGVFVGQPVLDANGIMGQVVAVNRWVSRVMLITDNRSAVPVQVVRNGLRAVLVGNGDSADLSLLHVTQTDDVQVGDVLVSSGLGEHFPLGYPVGVVSAVEHDAGQRFTTIAVHASAALHRSKQVLLVWSPEKQAATQMQESMSDS